MAGRSVEEACTAQHAAKSHIDQTGQTTSNKALSSTSVNIASGTNTTSGTSTNDSTSGSTPKSVIIGGVTYYPLGTSAPSAPSTANVALGQNDRIEVPISDSDNSSACSWSSYLVLSGLIKASVNWATYSDDNSAADSDIPPITSHSTWVLVAHLNECPFIFDSGASNHISPE